MEQILRLSDKQQAVLDWADNSLGSLILLARAGCGKSSTLLALVAHLVKRNPRVNIGIGAFNRPIANEFTAKLKTAGIDWRNAQSNTMHGFGMAALRKMFGWTPDTTPKPNAKKLAMLLDEELTTDAKRDKVEPYRAMILKAVSLAKQRAFGVLCSIDDVSKWEEIVDHFGLDEDLPEDPDMAFAIRTAIWLFKRSLARISATTPKEQIIFDFDDMILAPLFYKAKFWQYDWVLIDEAQDTNPARRALAMKLLKPGGRLVAVGDDAQAIYGFTGADADSLDLIKAETNAVTLPLNVTYRCPKAVVRRAQQWVPDLEAHESAPEGTERFIQLLAAKPGEPRHAWLGDEHLTADDAMLCRNTKPLVEVAYSLLRRGIACKVEGKKIGEGLVGLINRWKLVNTPTMIERLLAWRDKEVTKLTAKGKEDKAADLTDRVETIVTLAQQLQNEGKTTVVELVSFINGMFGDTPEGEQPKCFTLATAHKSKGREWKRVYILGQEKYMPSKWAKKDWEVKQEKHLMYVATTRAMSEIIDVEVAA